MKKLGSRRDKGTFAEEITAMFATAFLAIILYPWPWFETEPGQSLVNTIVEILPVFLAVGIITYVVRKFKLKLIIQWDEETWKNQHNFECHCFQRYR